MEKPRLFKNTNINVNNNKKACLLKNISNDNINNSSIDEELNRVFNSFRNIYSTKVEIETKDKTIETYLVSRTKNNIMTINREIIPIKDIVSLKIK